MYECGKLAVFMHTPSTPTIWKCVEIWEHQETSEAESQELEELIKTFKEKYSDREIIEVPDSKGIPYKYIAKAENRDVELLIEKDRVVLKAWKDDGLLCIVSNTSPRDILDNCPMKW